MCIEEDLRYLFVSETAWKGTFTFAAFTEEMSSTRDCNVRDVLDYSSKDPTFLFVKVVIWIDIKSRIIFAWTFFGQWFRVITSKNSLKHLSALAQNLLLCQEHSKETNEHNFTLSSGRKKNTYPSQTGKWNLARLNCWHAFIIPTNKTLTASVTWHLPCI